MSKITMLCPTRGRGHTLPLLCENLLDMCWTTSNFEILFMWDTDDLSTQDWLWKCRSDYPTLDIRLLGRPHSDNLSEDYFNWALHTGRPRGDVFWAIGDDVRMHTEHWDSLVLLELEDWYRDKPDRIGLCFARDLHETDKGQIGYRWGCFPILTKETYECLGWFFPKEFVTWEADVIMAKIFHDPRVDRLHMVDDVVIDQISYHAYGDVPRDEVALSMKYRHNNLMYSQMRSWYKQNQMDKDIIRLAKGIRNGMEKAESV